MHTCLCMKLESQSLGPDTIIRTFAVIHATTNTGTSPKWSVVKFNFDVFEPTAMLRLQVHACVHVCMRACARARVRVCVLACMCVYSCKERLRACVYSCKHAYMRMCVRACKGACFWWAYRSCAQVCARDHEYIGGFALLLMLVCACACTNTHQSGKWSPLADSSLVHLFAQTRICTRVDSVMHA